MSDTAASGYNPGCLFCRIIAKETEADIVAESELAVAFRDINPGAPVHVLVVPRRHIIDAAAITAADGDDVAAVYALAAHVAHDEKIAASGYRLVFNVGEDAGNTIAHLHLHLLGGKRLTWPPG